VKMVKFISVNTVYAVTTNNTLRAIASEQVAKDLYGDDWNKQIDDIQDVFFGNYNFGEDIDGVNDYNVQTEIDNAQTFDDTI